MRRICFLSIAAILPSSHSQAKEKPADQAPVAFGMLNRNAGCVIFEEGHKTSGRFWGVAVTTKTVGKLTVVETQNYTMDQKEILETQENLNDLMRRAQNDHIKFIKIPEKYSPDLLDQARTMCKQDQE